MSSIVMVGLLLSVSRQSKLPETEYDKQRATWQMSDNQAYEDVEGFTMISGGAGVSKPMPRSSRSKSSGRTSARPTQKVMQGRNQSKNAPRGRVSTDKRGRKRIDLGPSATDRLRGGNARPRR